MWNGGKNSRALENWKGIAQEIQISIVEKNE